MARREHHNMIEELSPFVRLLETGSIRPGKKSAEMTDWMLTLRWLMPDPHSKLLLLTDKGRGSIPEYLDNRWASWREHRRSLLEKGLQFGLEETLALERLEKEQELRLTGMLHHKTMNAVLGAHSKARLKDGAIPEGLTVTTDGCLRIRPNPGLLLRNAESEIDAHAAAGVLGEICLPERAFLGGLELAGILPGCILTTENLGIFIDLPCQRRDLMIIYTPGKDTYLTLRLLALLPVSIHCYHFGDLDPEGVGIARRLRDSARQAVQWMVPHFWRDHLSEAMVMEENDWYQVPIEQDEPDLLKECRRRGVWLEQEVLLGNEQLPKLIAALGSA